MMRLQFVFLVIFASIIISIHGRPGVPINHSADALSDTLLKMAGGQPSASSANNAVQSGQSSANSASQNSQSQAQQAVPSNNVPQQSAPNVPSGNSVGSSHSGSVYLDAILNARNG